MPGHWPRVAAWLALPRPALLCSVLLSLGLASAIKAFAADNPADLEFFEQKIRPILVDNCYQCHGQVTTKVKGGLFLTSRDGLRKGGESGPAIVPGDPEASLLIKAVRYGDEKLQMPPKNKRLSADKVADLVAWVKMGAPDPRVSASPLAGANTIPERAKAHWAFQPIREPARPAVHNSAWISTPVDNFILAKLEAAQLTPSPRADARTLIRRAYFDLTGLPPKPEEVAAFVADSSPEAFARVVDHLLASPQYGERWGRHWLDVARYADTKGYVFEEERRYPYSYTYRDYVINAFNQDLPYDQFLKQQIAADLLPLGEDKQPLAALGFLTLGRRFINNIHDIIDDRIDVVCRGTMGLTMACARCHDHKYDPMSTRDYYGLYGIFSSSMEPEEEPLLGTKPEAKLYIEYLAEHNKRTEERKKFIADKEAMVAADLRHKIGDYLLTAHEALVIHDAGKIEGVARKNKLDPDVVRRWMANLETWEKQTNPIFAAWYAFAKLPEKEFAPQAAELAKQVATGTNFAAPLNPLVAKAFSGPAPADLKEVATRYGKLFVETDELWLHAQEGTNKPTALPDPAAESLRQVLYGPDAPPNIPRDQLSRIFDVPTSQKVRELQRKIIELDATHLGAPPRAMAMQDRPNPGNVHVFLRGSPDNQGPEAPRAFPEFLSATNRQPFKQGSGRLELAEAITSRDNPLTARVFANRVWMHHFGASLVTTPSDFGLRAEAPAQLELLDFLAARFMADGWSVKQLHRLLLLSSAYQQSCGDNPEAQRVDPGNQLFWRMNRQRLEFEAMRDTLLSVAGNLDLKPGGHAVNIIEEPTVPRRTVYGYIDRQNLPGLLRSFDFASPDTSNPRRFYTTVPQQALFLMNSPFVIQQSRSLMERPELKAAGLGEEERIRKIYQLAFQREPTPTELQFGKEFLAAPPPPALGGNPSSWLYGYGGFDTNTQRVAKFRKLPHFTGSAFQGGSTLPDPKLGWVMVNNGGGHPGNDQEHAAIRRWVAPRAGTITISGTLSHPAAAGDGVRGRIVASGSGLLGEWLVKESHAETRVEKVTVAEGDKIDFVTDCRENENSDSFNWAPTIRFVADGHAAAAQKMEWNAAEEFGVMDPPRPQPLDRWQKYAQVLLLTNELVFVD